MTTKTWRSFLKHGWVVLAAWLFIGAVASPAAGQGCCRCDFNGVPSSCNTGIPDQTSCESVCAQLQSTFGQFQACPPGTEWDGCTGPDDPGFCDVRCAAVQPSAAAAPTMSMTGIVIAVAILLGLGSLTLRRRGRSPR